jgi:repressor LexA
MSGDGILPGDLALILLLPDPSLVDSGDLALVAIDDGEATLRRVHRENGVVALQAANPAYALQMFTGDEADRVKIIGKVKEIRRRIERKGEHKRLAE